MKYTLLALLVFIPLSVYGAVQFHWKRVGVYEHGQSMADVHIATNTIRYSKNGQMWEAILEAQYNDGTTQLLVDMEICPLKEYAASLVDVAKDGSLHPRPLSHLRPIVPHSLAYDLDNLLCTST